MLNINNLMLRMMIIILVFFLQIKIFGGTVSDWLIPKPQEINILKGNWKTPQGRIICNEISHSEVFKLIITLQQIFQKQGYFLPVAAIEAKDERACIKIKIDPSIIKREQAYSLIIDSTGLYITVHDAAGLFYAVQTLKQLAGFAAASGTWPMVQINDWPDFERRGVMLDISRDKVPTMTTLFHLIDLLSSWKVNEFQLYTEHTFAYRNYSRVWENSSPITSDEILQLDQYCKERFIDLVPNQSSFGHMENWLKFDEFLPLIECPDSCLTSDGMVSRLSISAASPGSLELMKELYAELLPNFSSDYFNINCDETVELGIGRSAELCTKLGKGQVYLDYVKSLRNLANHQGKKVQIWADILLKYPEVIQKLPKDMIPLIWGYEANHPFEKECAIMQSAGLEYYVCPGVSSWDALTGRTTNALGNIYHAGKAGKQFKAKGLLNTDWGDYGHWQPLSVSYPGYMYGAATAWNVESNNNSNFAFLLDHWVFLDKSGTLGQIVLDLGNLYSLTGIEFFNQTILFTSLRDIKKSLSQDENFKRLTLPAMERTDSSVLCNIGKLKQTMLGSEDAMQILSELNNAADLCHHSCRVIKDKLASNDGTLNNITEAERQFLLIDISRIIVDYRELWLKRNRIGGLKDSLNEMEKIRSFYQQIQCKDKKLTNVKTL
jgi:hexosaminidase